MPAKDADTKKLPEDASVGGCSCDCINGYYISPATRRRRRRGSYLEQLYPYKRQTSLPP
jgi:hypothetical protein